MPDAALGPDAAPSGTVHVTVLAPTGTGAPAIGVNVVFLDPDGTLVKRVATDTAGKADADLVRGGSVTSVAVASGAYHLETVLAVKPGDDLILGANADTTSIGTFTVSFPAYTAVTPASYTVTGPCGFVRVSQPVTGGPPPTTATLSFNHSCTLDTMEIVVQANDGSDNPLAVLDEAGVGFVANGSVALSGTYQSPVSFMASYTNVNANVSSLSTVRRVPNRLGISATAGALQPTAAQVLHVTGAVGSSALVDTVLFSTSRAEQIVRQVISGSTATYGLDLGATLLPWLGKPTFDAASGKIMVPTDMTGTTNAAPDVFKLQVSDSADASVLWTLYSPIVADVTLPSLPPEVGHVMPTASSRLEFRGIAVESDDIASYDEIRHDPDRAFALYSGNRPLGSTLRAVFTP